mmetsp:Transcript_7389/g.20120  ORF Transcript_7389/g.20120 Transcript_7389/m.20120 type:complete len:205 (+) Transcript_7389:301-915(+)
MPGGGACGPARRGAARTVDGGCGRGRGLRTPRSGTHRPEQCVPRALPGCRRGRLRFPNGHAELRRCRRRTRHAAVSALHLPAGGTHALRAPTRPLSAPASAHARARALYAPRPARHVVRAIRSAHSYSAPHPAVARDRCGGLRALRGGGGCGGGGAAQPPRRRRGRGRRHGLSDGRHARGLGGGHVSGRGCSWRRGRARSAQKK